MNIFMRFDNVKRIVLKVGSSTLTHESGLVNIRRVEGLIKVLSDIKNSGKEVILVSSGAVAVGTGKLGISRPSDMPSKQAAAAIGQCELMYMYDKLFGEYHHNVSQVLLTRDVVESEHRRNNVINTFNKLLEWKVIPVVNENDTVSVEEIEFGDNDTLSAIVATLTKSDLLIIMSDIDGLYTSNPKNDPTATKIDTVEAITEDIIKLAGGAGSTHGTGGMITKIQAATIANNEGIDMLIINGKNPEILYDVFEDETIGTLFKGGRI